MTSNINLSDGYYKRGEVSNSDLSALKGLITPTSQLIDPTEAYREGSLFDAMLTENYRVDYFKRTLDGDGFKKGIFEKMEEMKRSLLKDGFCAQFINGSDGQKVNIQQGKLYEYLGIEFMVDVRCKWDIWRDDLGFGGDLKTTTATSQRQFEQAALHFDYNRQRAFYMDIAGSERDILIGVSKTKPHKVFKIFIDRGSDFYRSGQQLYLELLYKFYTIYGSRK